MTERDIDYGVYVESGAKSLMADNWKWMGQDQKTINTLWCMSTPAIRNRWRARFRKALDKAAEGIRNGTAKNTD